MVMLGSHLPFASRRTPFKETRNGQKLRLEGRVAFIITIYLSIYLSIYIYIYTYISMIYSFLSHTPVFVLAQGSTC